MYTNDPTTEEYFNGPSIESVTALLKKKLLKYKVHCFIGNTGLTVADPVHTTKPSEGCVNICIPIDAKFITSFIIDETSKYTDEMLVHWVHDLSTEKEMPTYWYTYVKDLIQSKKIGDIKAGARIPVVTMAYTAEAVIDAYTSFIAALLWTDSSNLKFKGVGSVKKINEFKDVEYIVYEVSKEFFNLRLKFPEQKSSDDYRKCSSDAEQALFHAMHMKVLPLLNDTPLEEALSNMFAKWLLRYHILIDFDKEEILPRDIVLHYRDTIPEEILNNPYDWYLRTPRNLY